MLEIKKIMVKKLSRVTFIVVIILVFLSVIIQFGLEKRKIMEQSETFFDLMEQIVLENNHEVLNIEEEIRDRQIAATERFDLSYLLNLLRSNTKRIFHVIQKEDHRITASTGKSDIGKSIEEIGYNPRMIADTSVFYTTMYHQKYFSVCHAIGNQYLIYHCPVDELYDDLLPKALELGVLLAVIACIIIWVVVKYVDNLVIKNIQLINKNLSDISQGNLETKVDIRDSFEFKELSCYINNMVISLQEKAKKKEEIFTIVSQHSNKILYRYELKDRKIYPWDAENAKKDVLSHL